MFVSDIYPDCRAITNFASQALNFRRIGDAVELLRNKSNGAIDAEIGFVNVPIPASGRIRLPRDVETPVKVNLNGNPTFARDKFYEFTLNGPGSNEPRLEWQWEDQQTSPLQVDLPGPTAIEMQSTNAADDGLTVRVYGRLYEGAGALLAYEPSFEDMIMSADTPFVTSQIFSEISALHLPPGRLSAITILTSPDEVPLALFRSSYDTDPKFRIIKVSATSGVARIMFRRSNLRVRSIDDWISIGSKIALIRMMQAIEARNNDQTKLADDLETDAVKLAKEQQDSHSAFVQMAAQEEVAGILNLNINNRDTLIAADVYDEFSFVLGPVGRQKIFDKMTECCEILGNKGNWDPRMGVVDITTDQYRYATLPRYVDSVVKLNIAGRHADRQSNWYTFSGTGNWCGRVGEWLPCNTWAPVPGRVVTYRDVTYTQFLAVVPDLDIDLDVVFRVYGFYQGKRIFTTEVDGTNTDGFLVQASADGTVGSSQPVDRIERITKSVTKGFVKLIGSDSAGNTPIQIGYYWPDETEPNYKRIHLPRNCSSIRILYRRNELKITSLTDPLHLKSRTAMTDMVKSLKQRDGGNTQGANELEANAEAKLREEKAITDQSEIPDIEFDHSMTRRYV